MKKIICILIIIIILSCLYFGSFGTFEKKGTIDYTVKTIVRIQYGWGDINDIKALCTDEGSERIDFDSLSVGLRLYYIDDSYKEECDEEKEKLTLHVKVYSPDILFHVISLVKTNDGRYKISDIQMDI